MICVADFGANRIALVDLNGDVQDEIGLGTLHEPTGVAFIGKEILTVDWPRRLHHFDLGGTVIRSTTIPGATQPQAVSHIPTTQENVITEFQDDKLICLDDQLSLIHSQGTGVTSVSSPGPDDFHEPKDILYAEDQQVGPSVFVADSANNRVLRICVHNVDYLAKMTLDWNNTKEFKGTSNFRPVGVAYHQKDEVLFCVDGAGGDIWEIDVRSGAINRIFNNPGTAPGQLSNPVGIDVVADDYLAVSDWNTNRVTIFEIQ